MAIFETDFYFQQLQEVDEVLQCGKTLNGGYKDNQMLKLSCRLCKVEKEVKKMDPSYMLEHVCTDKTEIQSEYEDNQTQ